MSFGSNLWDRQESINNYLMTGKDQMMSLNDLMKTLAGAEEAYASTVSKMVKSYKDSIAKANEKSLKTETPMFPSNIRDSWETLIRGLETKANTHKDICDAITKQRKVLKESAKALEVKHEHNWDKIRASMTEINKMISAMESKNQAYYKDMQHIETCSTNLKKFGKERKEKEANKARADLDKYLNEVNRSIALYQEDIKKVNEAKRNHFEVLVKNVLNDLQTDDELIRSAGIKESLAHLSDIYLNAAPLTMESWTVIQKKSASIDPAVETAFVVSALTTGNSLPADFDFTDTANEFQQKKALQPVSIESEGEDLSHIPDYNKKGKKIIAEKIKDVEADIIEIEKRRQIFEGIAASSSTRDTSLFEAQKSILHDKTNSLLMKKHRMHVFVAQHEGKPIPNSPGIKTTPLQPLSAASKILDSVVDRPSQKSLSFEKLHNFQKQHEKDIGKVDLVVPAPIVEKNTGIGGSKASIPSPPTQTEPMEEIPKNAVKLKALYDFDAANEMEVSIKIGDLLDLVIERDDGWSQCISQNGIEGLVPTAYVGRI